MPVYHMVLNYKFMSENLFTVCTEQMRYPYTKHAADGLPNPSHLEVEVRFVQAKDQQVTTRSPR